MGIEHEREEIDDEYPVVMPGLGEKIVRRHWANRFHATEEIHPLQITSEPVSDSQRRRLAQIQNTNDEMQKKHRDHDRADILEQQPTDGRRLAAGRHHETKAQAPSPDAEAGETPEDVDEFSDAFGKYKESEADAEDRRKESGKRKGVQGTYDTSRS